MVVVSKTGVVEAVDSETVVGAVDDRDDRDEGDNLLGASVSGGIHVGLIVQHVQQDTNCRRCCPYIIL